MSQDDNNDPVLSNGIPVDIPEIAPFNPQEVTCIFDCSEQNVTKCRKCNRPFCIMHANRFSPNFCKECFANLSVIEGKFQRTFESYNEDTDTVSVVKESCTKYHMDGPDWPFLVAFIDNLTDDELKAVWNFHFFVMKQIEAENETRKIEHNRVLRNTPTPRIVTQTVTKKTVIKKPETQDDIRKKLEKLGIPANIIDQMLKTMSPTP